MLSSIEEFKEEYFDPEEECRACHRFTIDQAVEFASLCVMEATNTIITGTKLQKFLNALSEDFENKYGNKELEIE